VEPDFVIETERLRLRPYLREDADELAAMFADPDHMRFYPATFTPEQTREWVSDQLERYQRDGFAMWVVEDLATGSVIGTCGPAIRSVEEAEEVEIGWHVRPGWKGRGIAPEAAAAVRDWVFENLGVDHIISLVRPENLPSVRVAEKIGMRIDREVDYHGFPHLVHRIDRGPGRSLRPASRGEGGTP
jgi:RimJ/RimL family protein N-acetyltransferase